MTQTQEHNVPALRFPEFSGGWKSSTLGKESVCLDNKRVPLKEGDRSKRRGAYPYYGASGIIDTIDDYLFDETLVLLAEDGANIIMRNSPIAFLAKGKIWVNNHAHVYRAKGSPLFLATYLENLRYDKYNTGTAQPKLNGETCKKLKLNFPPLPEQQKIASFLSQVDCKIAQLGEKKALLQAYKKGMMQKLFSGELRFKDPQGHDFPDWEEKRLIDVAYKTASSISANSLKDSPGEYPVYGASGVAGYVDYYSSETSHISVVKDGAGVGRLFFCPAKSSILGTLESVVAKNDNDTLFIYYWMSKINFKAFTTGSTIPHVYFKDYGRKKDFLPYPEEQQKIADFLSSIDRKIDLVSTELNHAKTFKKGLLQQMFI